MRELAPVIDLDAILRFREFAAVIDLDAVIGEFGAVIDLVDGGRLGFVLL